MPTLLITATPDSVNEDAGTVTIIVVGTWSVAPGFGGIGVNFRVGAFDASSDSAEYRSDYVRDPDFGQSLGRTFYGERQRTATVELRVEIMDDTNAEGDEFFTITAAVPAFALVTPATVVIVDNDKVTPTGIMLSVDPTHVTEGSETNPTPVTITAAFMPTGATQTASTTVMVSVDGGSTNGATEGMDFTTISAPIPVIIRGNRNSGTGSFDLTVADDSVSEPAETVTVSAPAVSGHTVMSATLTITDNDTDGVTVSTDTLAVTEGAEGSYTVVLDSQPAGPVEVTIAADSGSAPPITFSPPSLSFNSGNWNTAQTVTVTAIEDADTAGGTRTLSHTVSGYGTVTVAPVTVTVTDNNMAGVTLSAATLEVTEGGAEGSYTVVLASEPAGTVEVTIAADSDTAPPITVSPASLSFDSTDWETAQTVTVTAIEDADTTGGTRTLTHTVSGYGTVTSADPVTVTVTDSNMAGVTVSTTTLEVTEGGAEGSYTVVLDTEPAGTVEVTIAADSGTAPPITFSPASLSFDSTTWNTAETVTVTAIEDADAVGGTRTLEHTVTGYGAVTDAGTVTIVVLDDEAPTGIALSLTPSSVTEGGTMAAVTVTAAFVPPGTSQAAPITVPVRVGVTPGTATAGTDFTAISEIIMVTIPATETESTIPGEFTFETLEDTIFDPDETVSVDVDGMVDGFTVTGTTLTITDNDIPPTEIELSVNSGNVVDPTRVTEDSGTTTVMVTAAFPAGSPMLTTATDVEVTVAGGTAETADFTAAPASLTVTIPAESTSGMVTGSFDLAVVDDGDEELDETVTVSGMALGTTTITSIPSATLTITDNDPRPEVDDVDITPSVLESAGGSAMATFTVTLRTRSYRETTVTMGLSPRPGSASGLATDGADYTLNWLGPDSDEFVITVDPDELTGTGVFSLSVAEDDIVEGNEGIGFSRLRVNGVVPRVPTFPVVLRIVDNDEATVRLDSPTVVEGAGPVTVTATVDKMVPGGFTIPVSTVFGSAGASDFTVVTDEILRFAGNELGETETFMVTITDDSADEEAEMFGVSLGTAGDFRFYTFSLISEAGTLDPTVNAGSPGTVTINDDDPPTGITLSVTPDSVAEGSDPTVVTVTAAFSPVGAEQETDAIVSVTVAGGSATADTDFTAVSAPIPITIAAGSTSFTGVFTLTVMDDTDEELAETLTFTAPNVDSLSVTGTTLTIPANDTDGVTVSTTTLAVTEGAEGSYTVVLNSQPAGPVEVTIAADSSTAPPITFSPPSLSFNSGNWNMAQTVTVTAIEDADTAGGTRTLAHTVSGYGTVTSADPVTVTVTDNNMAGVILSATTLEVTEGAEGSYTVVLASEPAGTVEVTIAADSDTAPPITVSSASLSFDSSNWNTARTVTVTATEDDDAIGGLRTLSHTVTGYGTVTADSVEVTVTDIDVAMLNFDPVQVDVTEGTGDLTLAVVLDRAIPTGFEVTISTTGYPSNFLLTAMEGSDFTETTTTLTFAGTAGERKTLTVPILNDDVVEGPESFGIGAIDAAGSLLMPEPVSDDPDVTLETLQTFVNFGASALIDITDDDTAGVTISETSLAITEEAAAASYTVVLDSDPDGDVTVTIDLGSSTTAPITVDPASLTLAFDSTDWNMHQTVTVTATEDDDAIGGLRTLSHTVTGYGTVTADSVEVTVTDIDVAMLNFDPVQVDVTEGTGDLTLTVVLDRAIPTGFEVTISTTGYPSNFLLTAMEGSDFTETTTTLTFAGTAGERKTLTVPILNDDVAEGPESFGIGAIDAAGSLLMPEPVSDDPDVTLETLQTFVNFGASALIDITDDDTPDTGTPGVTIDPTTLTVSEGGEQTYTVVLDTAPAGNVTVAIDPGSGATAPIMVSALSLSFSPTTWAAAQTVTVTATEDDDAIGGMRTLSHTVTGYGAVTADSVEVTVTDIDVAMLNFDPVQVDVTEGTGDLTLAVVLDRAIPTGFEVTISTTGYPSNFLLTAMEGSDFTETTTTLTFAGTAGERKTLTVPILNDDVAEGPESFGIGAIDAAGSLLMPEPVSDDPDVTLETLQTFVNFGASALIDITDDDTAGVTISETSLAITEEAAAASYTVVLDSDPDGDVTVTIDPGTSTTAPITVESASPLPLTFDSTNWRDPQTVTVTATEDDDAIGGTLTLAHMVTGYRFLTSVASVEVTVSDIDVAEFSFEGGGIVNVSEGIGDATLTAVLDRAIPTGFEVTISIMGSADSFLFNAEEGRDFDLPAVSDMTLTFVGTANERQTLTVPIIDDDVAENAEFLGFGVAMVVPPQSELPFVNFGGRSSGQIQITDDDTAGVIISETSLAITEEGMAGTYTVELNSDPDGDVTVTVVQDNSPAPPITVESTPPLPLVFTSANWNMAQTVTVTATGDEDAIGGTRTLMHTVSGYGSVETAAPVTVEVTDDDTTPTGIALSVTPDSVAEGSSPTVVTVTAAFFPVGAELATEAIVMVTVAGDTADASDFTATPATIPVTIAVGQTSNTGTFTLAVEDDPDEEVDETLTLTAPAVGTLSVTGTTLTIPANDGVPTPTSVVLSLSEVSVPEGGDSGTTTPPVMVTASFLPAGAMRLTATDVMISVAGGVTNPAGAADFTATGFTVTIPGNANSMTAALNLQVAGDTLVEEDETLEVSGSLEDSLSVTSATLTITDDDSATIAFNATNVTVDEGDRMATLMVTLTGEVQDGFEVTLSTTDGTAVAVSDYSTTSTTLAFAGGEETQTFTVPIIDDAVVEGNEAFTVSLGTPSGTTATINTGPIATVTITDDDSAAVTFSAPSVTVREGDDSTATVTATLNNAVQDSFEVTVSASPGTATSVSDYAYTVSGTTTNTTLTFAGAPGEVQEFMVGIVDDAIAEGDETFTVSLSDDAITSLDITADDSTTITITDDDDAEVSLGSVTVDENVGGATVTVVATLDHAVQDGFEVTISTTDGTATSPSDYTATTTTRMFQGAIGETFEFTVPITDNNIVDGDKEFTVVLSTLAQTTATVAITDTATITIEDDDTAPTEIILSVSPPAVVEGDSVTVTTPVTVTAAFPVGSAVLETATDVQVTVADGGTDGATAGVDYTAVAPFTVTILAGDTSGTHTFDFVVTGDTTIERNETVTVSGMAAAPITPITPATLTISNDDQVELTGVTLSSSEVLESADPVTVTVTANIASASPDPTMVGLAVASFGPNAATPGVDYTVTPSIFSVTILAGATSGERSFVLTGTSDDLAEEDETIQISARLGTALVVATLRIINDATPITLSLSPLNLPEGATTPVTATAAFSGISTLTEATEVEVSVVAGTADAADFSADPATITVSIPAGATSGTASFMLTALEDTAVDPDETVTVSVTVPAEFLLLLSDVTLTITDNDAAPTQIALSLSQPSVEEGASPTVTVTAAFPVGSAVLETATAVTVSVAAGTAEAADFTATPATLTVTIAAGATTGTASFTLAAADDTLMEGDETVTVSGTTTATGFTTITSATLTILDADRPRVTLGDATVEESGGMATIMATLSAEVTAGFEVTASPSDGTAEAGSDYTDVTRMLSFNGTPGEVVMFTVPILANDVAEEDETFTVSLSGLSVADSVVNITSVTSSATVTITDDDSAAIFFDDTFPFVFEDDGMVTIMMTLDNEVQDAFEVTVSTEDDTATAGSDYEETSMTLSFTGSAWEEKTFTVSLIDNDVVEDLELFLIRLSGFTTTADVVVEEDFGVDFVTVEIEDDDTAEVTFSAPRVTVDESAGTVTLTATLDNVAQDRFEVEVSASPGTATSPSDYTLTSTTLIFPEMTQEAEFTVSITDDGIVENTEMFTVSLTESDSTPFGITASDTTTITITDDDIAPTEIELSLSQATPVAEGASSMVTVTAAFPPADDVRLIVDTVVTVTVGAGTDSAEEGTDYTAVADLTVTIGAGATSGTGSFVFAPTDDTIVDPGETVTVSGTAAGFTTITSATLAITDTDTAPTAMELSLSETTPVTEGASPMVTVTATLSPTDTTLAADTVVAVAVGATGDSATDGRDYTSVVGLTVTIAAGATSGTNTFDFVVTDDTIADPDETVTVSGTAVGFTTITSATLTINDNDTAPTEIVLSLSPADADEGATTPVTVTATLSGTVSLAEDTVVTVAVGDGTGSATEGTDYTEVSDFTVTIPAEMTSGMATFQFAATDDTIKDPDETVTVFGTAGTFTITSTTLTITDTDTAPTTMTLSITPDRALEGATTTVMVTATLSPTSITLGVDTEVLIAVLPFSPTATAGTDFTAVPRFMLTIPAEMTSGTASFDLVVADDTEVDPDEMLSVFAFADGFRSIRDARLTIIDTDTPPTAITLSLTPASVAEGATTTVTVTAAFPQGVTALTDPTVVTVSVAAGTAEAADFTAVTSFPVTIAANTLIGMGTFTLTVTDDTVAEGPETLTVSGTAAASFDTIPPVTLTITDDDTAPTAISLVLNPATPVLENSGTTTVTVTAAFPQLSAALPEATVVTVAVGAGTDDPATEGLDYTEVPDFTVTIAAGATSGTATFDLAVADDTLVEGPEALTVSGTAAASFGTIPPATLTITDDDTAPTAIELSLSPGDVSEADTGIPLITVTASFRGSIPVPP